jgi:hypothetical protein
MTTTTVRTSRTTVCGGCYHRVTRHADGEGACTVRPVHSVTLAPAPCTCQAVEGNAFQELSDEERRAHIMAAAARRA